MLTSAECSPGTIFISLAPSRNLFFISIFLVARILDLSGSMNTFADGWPVSSIALVSCLAATPDVAPVSMIPICWFATFHAHFAAILFCWIGDAVVIVAAIVSVFCGLPCSVSCSLTRQDSEDQ